MEKEFKGTKGKWNIHNDNEIGLLIGGYNPISDVCTVHRYGDKIEENANAILIENAPELLQSLRDLVWLFENHASDEELTESINLRAKKVLEKVLA